MAMRSSAVGAVAFGAALVFAGTTAARAAEPETYGDYSLMFSRSAGQYFAGDQVGGQWAWSPQSAATSDISWGDPAKWPPSYAEHFVRSGDWVELDGYSDGQGRPVTEVQRVTSEKVGDADCGGMSDLPSDGGRQHYARWTIPATGYCLDAVGTITSTANGSVVHFRHRQQWTPPASCSNAYFSDRRCITQHEQWWDDNGHAYGLQIDRTQYVARGLGMAFAIRQTAPVQWSADGRYYWSW
ncbi:hypothetical protein [Actinoallomurus sp. CA-150999]|uniref:hypothetical protein n=1 Tax=Actinoallomurus sp. CA-150999 TaxID=3239887 RepID=UPI003D936319